MSKSILNTGILAVAFLLLFALSEFLYHRVKLSSDITRKIVHVGTGILTLLFPAMLANHWLVLFLCASFAIILILSIKFKLLKSINSIERSSFGSILYPVAVYGCYLAYNYFEDLIFFYLPIVTLAICDPVAAFMGERWPYGTFNIGRHKKTLTGSISFLLSSVAVSLLLYQLISKKDVNQVMGVTLIIAVASSVIEAISVKGFDNITIPACVIVILTLYR